MATVNPVTALRDVLSPASSAMLAFPWAAYLSPTFRSRPAFRLSLQTVHPLYLRLPLLSLGIKIPSIFSELWESILRAVPKKKTSHRKKRQRFMAGKGLKDVINLNKCSACGNVKRAHLLCPYCVKGK